MGSEFKHINDARGFIVDKLSDDALLGRNGYMMRQALYIIDYDPAQQQYAADLVRAICEKDTGDLPRRGVTPVVVNLYDLVLGYLDEQDLWGPLVEAEPDTPRLDLIQMLQDTVGVKDVVAPRVNEVIASHPEADIAFVTGVGETFPYVRTHTLLEEISSPIPVVLVFPGRYEQHSDGSTALNILGLTQASTGGYYRATRVFDL